MVSACVGCRLNHCAMLKQYIPVPSLPAPSSSVVKLLCVEFYVTPTQISLVFKLINFTTWTLQWCMPNTMYMWYQMSRTVNLYAWFDSYWVKFHPCYDSIPFLLTLLHESVWFACWRLVIQTWQSVMAQFHSQHDSISDIWLIPTIDRWCIVLSS